MVESDLDINSASSSFAFTEEVNPELLGLDPLADKEQYHKDKVCTICKDSFNLLKHKYRCKFCWRGVCSKCSKQKAINPILGGPQRICDKCFPSYIEKLSRVSMKMDDINRSRQNSLAISQEILSVIQERNKEQMTKKVLEHKYELLEAELEDGQIIYEGIEFIAKDIEVKIKENEELLKQIERLENDIKHFSHYKSSKKHEKYIDHDKIKEMNANIENTREANQSLEKCLNELKEEAEKVVKKKEELTALAILLNEKREERAKLKQKLELKFLSTPNKSCCECSII
ncbi:unnamed protein product [Blepharisma stoltei]|uniref:FYVE-type domain-containing protein n=1 Tax=Blepharisma stoltei TaxID=1481888 RepID=A0AAU9IBR0_9CILI|nr:unnamed protein product [Blepharisma stoltei]